MTIGERRAARDAEPLSLFPSRVPPPTPPTPYTPCLPVSLGNLQLKASHPHSNMYPSNKKKKVWREEKGNRLVESWGCGGWEWGGGGGQGCVCRGALRPSSRLAPAWPVPPPSCVVCTHAPAHRRARAAPGHLQLAHVWAHAPLCRPPRPVTFSPGWVAFASLAAWTRARHAQGSAYLPQIPHPFSRPLLGLWYSWPGCPTDLYVPAGGHARCSCCCISAPRRPSSILRLCLVPYSLSWQCPHLRVFTPSLGPLLLCRSVTFETWNSKGNLKRASCP